MMEYRKITRKMSHHYRFSRKFVHLIILKELLSYELTKQSTVHA
jgi:hypothetical protein